MNPFGFATRLLIVLVVSLVALQFATVMVYFSQRAKNTHHMLSLPLPDQLAAMVRLFEDASPMQRDLLLRAMNSSDISVQIEQQKPDLEPETWRRSPIVEELLKSYLASLGDHTVTVLLQPRKGSPAARIGRASVFYPATGRILVELKSGETLDIGTTGILSISLFGLPLGFVAGILGSFVAIAVFFVVRAEARPLRELAKAVDTFDPDAKCGPLPDPPKSAKEIRALIGAFNAMRERIAYLVCARMALAGGISHDLRTYATRLRFRCNLIADEDEKARANADIDDMMRILDDSLLAFSGRRTVSQEELLDLSEMLEAEANEWALRGKTVSYEKRIPPQFPPLVLGHRVSLRRLFTNIVDNAVKYGGEASILIQTDASSVEVTIDDRGEGIPPERRKAVLEPFIRLEGSRSRKTGGAGLGLAIAKAVVDAHQGALSIGSNPSSGARLTVSLRRFQYR